MKQAPAARGGRSLRFIPITGNGGALQPVDIECKLPLLAGEVPETRLRLRRQGNGYVLVKVLLKGESGAPVLRNPRRRAGVPLLAGM